MSVFISASMIIVLLLTNVNRSIFYTKEKKNK